MVGKKKKIVSATPYSELSLPQRIQYGRTNAQQTTKQTDEQLNDR